MHFFILSGSWKERAAFGPGEDSTQGGLVCSWTPAVVDRSTISESLRLLFHFKVNFLTSNLNANPHCRHQPSSGSYYFSEWSPVKMPKFPWLRSFRKKGQHLVPKGLCCVSVLRDPVDLQQQLKSVVKRIKNCSFNQNACEKRCRRIGPNDTQRNYLAMLWYFRRCDCISMLSPQHPISPGSCVGPWRCGKILHAPGHVWPLSYGLQQSMCVETKDKRTEWPGGTDSICAFVTVPTMCLKVVWDRCIFIMIVLTCLEAWCPFPES